MKFEYAIKILKKESLSLKSDKKFHKSWLKTQPKIAKPRILKIEKLILELEQVIKILKEREGEKVNEAL